MSWMGLGRHLRLGIEVVAAVAACAVCSVGCGNPEAPKIEKVRLSYWDALEDGGSWVALEDGGQAPKSPVRIEGTLSDNTAVVNPRITWIGVRGDVDEEGFAECSKGVNDFYECVMECEETREGFFECSPMLPFEKLIRGDQYSLTLETNENKTFELEIDVSEAQDLLVPKAENEPIQVIEDYRIITLSSLKGDPNPFLWSLLQRKAAGGDWLPLRSGDVLALGAGDSAFQIGVEEPEGVELASPPTATWRSLVKWNDDSFLEWDATTGSFKERFQLFDPRDPRNLDEPEEGEPTYRFVVSAEDVPDQKTGEFRFSEVAVDLFFSPDIATEAPDLEVNGEDKGLIETKQPGDLISGTVLSFSGEVRSLLYTIYDSDPAGNPGAVPTPAFYLDPELISLEGKFSETMVYVSDWKNNKDGAPEPDGVVDKPSGDQEIPNNVVEVVALDVQGNSTRSFVSIAFTPATKGDAAPELQLREIFPAVDSKGRGLLPFGEQMRVRARAADDRGQPAFSAWECLCEAEEPRINAERCPCNALTGQPDNPWKGLNAGGEYPWNPWQWIVIEPASETKNSFLVLRAKEKVEEDKDKPVAKFTAIPIDFEPSPEEQAYDMTVEAVESAGPNVALVDLKNGDIVTDPNSFIVEATILPRLSELNRITALWNGEPRGQPSYDSEKGAFVWDLQAYTVHEGDRICVGAVSLTGHATLDVLEFAETSEGLLLGVTVTSDPGACD